MRHLTLVLCCRILITSRAVNSSSMSAALITSLISDGRLVLWNISAERVCFGPFSNQLGVRPLLQGSRSGSRPPGGRLSTRCEEGAPPRPRETAAITRAGRTLDGGQLPPIPPVSARNAGAELSVVLKLEPDVPEEAEEENPRNNALNNHFYDFIMTSGVLVQDDDDDGEESSDPSLWRSLLVFLG